MEKLPNKIELNCDDGDVNGAESDNEKDIDSGNNNVTFYRFFGRSSFISFTPCDAIKEYTRMGSKFCWW